MFIHAYTKTSDSGYTNSYFRINEDGTWDRLIDSKWLRLGTPSPTISATRAKVIKFYGRRLGNVIESAPCLESFVELLARETYREEKQHPIAIQELMNACDANSSPRCQAALAESLRYSRHNYTLEHLQRAIVLTHDHTYIAFDSLPETQLPKGETTFVKFDELLTYLQSHDAPEITRYVLDLI